MDRWWWVLFHSVLDTPYLPLKSEGTTKERRRNDEGTTKAWRRQSVSAFDIMIPKKTNIRLPLCVKKSGRKWHLMTITITITIGVKPLFTPHFTLHFTICKANIVTDSYIRSQFLHDAITECVGSFATIVFSLRHTSYHAQNRTNVLFGQLPHLRICRKNHK